MTSPRDELKSTLMTVARRENRPLTEGQLIAYCGDQHPSFAGKAVFSVKCTAAIEALVSKRELAMVPESPAHDPWYIVGDKAAKVEVQGPPLTVWIDPGAIDPAYAAPVAKTQPQNSGGEVVPIKLPRAMVKATEKAVRAKAAAKTIEQPVATVRVDDAPTASLKGLWAELEALRDENEQLRSSVQQASPIEVLAGKVKALEVELNALNNEAMALGATIQQKENMRTALLTAMRELQGDGDE